ncbi:LacI family DNA-binding transcriptional regulator [Hymenobacter mellowenesis]|uniref:LacI family DNA-binding transcriptional regulator n=1 Tax=Hymenobacter mellowenesis TaxID=3063995 RepID=UPI00351018E2
MAGPQHLRIYAQRRQGYIDALATKGVAELPELLTYSDMTVAAGTQVMQQLLALATPPDAVFGAGDSVVLGALQVLKQRGLRVPQDVALAGFSNEGFTTIVDPPLTSVDQCCEEMGAAAVRLFLEMVRTTDRVFVSRQVVLRPRLYVRESSQRQGLVRDQTA